MKWFFVCAGLLMGNWAMGQADSVHVPLMPGAFEQKDLLDEIKQLFPRVHLKNHDTTALQTGRKFVVVIPQIGYSPQTSFMLQVLNSLAFRKPSANVSTIISSIAYTENNQLIFTAMSNLWATNNALNFTSDWRLMHYPQSTYGLGMYTSTDNPVKMDYEYLRLYQQISKRILPNLYAGLGYELDYHWNITSYNSRREVTRISRYPFGVAGTSVSSGVSMSWLYDNRANSINPTKGFYANLMLRANFRALGSDNTYQNLLLDVRKYVHFPGHSENVLAFWSYNVFNLSGNPPFLDLPSTGWDTYSNTGRGHIQGRFRGKNLLYVESEYRFALSRNRLFGGVAFANAQTVSEPGRFYFARVVPAAGVGLRVRLNKFSRTNLAVDYGRGFDGSQGIVFNLGEVF